MSLIYILVSPRNVFLAVVSEMISIQVPPGKDILGSPAGGIITRDPLVLDGTGMVVFVVAHEFSEGFESEFVAAIPTTWMLAPKHPARTIVVTFKNSLYVRGDGHGRGSCVDLFMMSRVGHIVQNRS